MASKILAQVIIQGMSVFTKAFAQALQQGRANARAGGSAAATQAVRRGNHMGTEEAFQVLNVKRSDFTLQSTEEILKIYNRMFDANDPQKGGSFYLQSKVYRAKEALDLEIEQMIKDAKRKLTQ